MRRVIPRSLFFPHRALFISSQLSFCAVFYGLSQLVSSWSHRKIHHVSPNHQSAGGGEPFFFCVVLLSAASKKNSTDAAGTRSSLWPSHSSEALQRHSSAPHHTSGLAVRSSGVELRRRRGGLCEKRVKGAWGQLRGSLTSSSCGFNQDPFQMAV